MKSRAIKRAHGAPWLSTNSKDDTTKCKYVTIGAELGDGSFSVVKECMNVYTRHLFALKMIHKSVIKDRLQLVKRELNLLAEISGKIKELERRNYSSMDVFQGHHHILQLYDYFETEDDIALVTQLCDKGDLYEKIINQGHLDLETQVKPYTACLVSVLVFLHSQTVVHRDIKAENVLFRLKIDRKEPPQGRLSYDRAAHDLVLADFGFATKIKSEAPLKEYVGTVSYLAPEIVRCKNVNYISESKKKELRPYGYLVDVWALGVLTYFMALGYMPFDCDNENETLDCILSRDYYLDEDMEKDPKMFQFWSFIQKCFHLNSEERATPMELKNHPFIADYFFTTASELDHAKVVPHSMKRSASSRSFKIPTKSTSNVSVTHIQTPPQFGASRSILESELANNRTHTQVEARGTDLRRTLSTTALHQGLVVLPDATRNIKRNSTFVLDQQPPSKSLMNGCYSTSPESVSL